MFQSLHLDRYKAPAKTRTAGTSTVLVLMVWCGCLNVQVIGDDVTARQRFVVEVSGGVSVKSTPTLSHRELSRVEISSLAEVVLALSSVEESASSSAAVFLLHCGQSCSMSIHRESGPLRSQTVFMSDLPCLELSAEATPVLTISSI